MRINYLLFLAIIILSCISKEKPTVLSIRDKYASLDSFYTSQESFNDSICKLATDSASKRFKQNKFELFAFLPPDSSETPIHLLQDRFRLHVIGFTEKDIVFRFCYNEAMIHEFEAKFKFNPIYKVRILYDSLEKIGQTNIPHKFGTGMDDLYRYLVCNLEFPHGTEDILPPYPLVRVRFRISPSGQADSIRIVESFSEEYDNVVLKLIGSMPRWRPRRNDQGEYDPVFITYPIRFNPTEREKYCR